MKKFKIGLYAIGVFNGIVFTFAFLCLIVGMDEEFHFMDTEEPLGVDSIVFMDLSSYNIEDIESEYFKGEDLKIFWIKYYINIQWLELFGKKNGIQSLILKKLVYYFMIQK